MITHIGIIMHSSIPGTKDISPLQVRPHFLGMYSSSPMCSLCTVNADSLCECICVCESYHCRVAMVAIQTNRTQTKPVHKMLNVDMCICAGYSCYMLRQHSPTGAACPRLSAATIYMSL